MPYASKLYPTTDEHLYSIVKMYKISATDYDEKASKVAQFILDHRTQIKFRIQSKITAFYTNEDLAKCLITKFWEDWYGSESVNPKYKKLGKNTVGCKRLPHGKYQYQVHLKKDVHQYISNSDKESLYRLLINNNDSFKITNKYVQDYLSGLYPHCYHGYFYVSEQKMVTPIYMIAQKGIDKVIKFVAIKNERNTKIKRS